jgi:hypothetical protein
LIFAFRNPFPRYVSRAGLRVIKSSSTAWIEKNFLIIGASVAEITDDLIKIDEDT